MTYEVVPVIKPEGFTSTQLISSFKKQFSQYAQEKISPAGRLDPMAEGVILLLIGEANKMRSKFLALDKTYEFIILLGIASDTYDLLGKITQNNLEYDNSLIKKDLIRLLPNYLGTFQQLYPPYSSKPVQGRPLFFWARQERLSEITIPAKTVKVKKISVEKWEEREMNTLKKDIINRLAKVEGDFRQEEIISNWKDFHGNPSRKILLVHCVATVTSGTYIRSLCHEIGKGLGIGALAYSIKRTKVGNYDNENALLLNVQ